MPALNYKREFADAVESGKKRQTIRAWRARPFRIGDMLSHYVDQRQPTARLLLHVECRMAIPIDVWPVMCSFGGHDIIGEEAESFAKADGFESFDELAEWLRKSSGGLPFHGQLIMW